MSSSVHIRNWNLSVIILILSFFCVVRASPVPKTSAWVQTPGLYILAPFQLHILPRTIVTLNNVTGTLQVFNPTTEHPIAQGSASDGSGSTSDADSSFTAPALLWIGFCFVVGVPMAFAGIRGWRLTTGVGIGLATSVCAWAAFINTVSSDGLPDIVLTIIALAFFSFGFILGLFEIGRIGGIILLGVTGGLAFGIRIVLLRDGLLFQGNMGGGNDTVLDGNTGLFAANWAIVAVLGAVGGLFLIWRQRISILVSSASVGTFLSFLAIDLIINKQIGLSRGLRFLFDRNSSHLADILTAGYSPPVSTKILVGTSLALVPVLAYAQHRVFSHPFSRKPDTGTDLNSLNLDPSYRKEGLTGSGASIVASSRFSL